MGELSVISREAVALNRVFIRVRPLVARSRRVSLNARCAINKAGSAAGPFEVVAAELGRLGESLGGLIRDAEDAFGRLVHVSSRLAREAVLIEKFADALRALGGPGEVDADAVVAALSTRRARLWEANTARMAPGDPRRAIWGALLRTRRALVGDLSRVDGLAADLHGLISRVQDLAMTQGYFIGFNARMEATRLAGTAGGLDAVADDITQYARETSVALAAIGQQVSELLASARVLTEPLAAEMHRAEAIERSTT